jgi:hypothetical protein
VLCGKELHPRSPSPLHHAQFSGSKILLQPAKDQYITDADNGFGGGRQTAQPVPAHGGNLHAARTKVQFA